MKLAPNTTAALIVAVSGLATPVLAQTIAQPIAAVTHYGTWAVQVGAATDNRSKDASKSNGQGYAYGTVIWTAPNGVLYAASGFETVDSSTGSQLELQGFFGVKKKVSGTAIDLRAAYKFQRGSNPNTDNEAWEFTGNFTRPVGPVKARLQVQFSPDGTGGVRSWSWIEGRIGYDITPRLNAAVAVGRREQDGSVDYTGWNAGLTFAANSHTNLDVRYYATDAHVPGEQYADRLVAGINLNF